MIFCTVIEAQIVFETLLVLVTIQLAIVGQLGRKVPPVECWVTSWERGNGDDLEEGFLGRWGLPEVYLPCSGAMVGLEVKAFPYFWK